MALFNQGIKHDQGLWPCALLLFLCLTLLGRMTALDRLAKLVKSWRGNK
jgi:hypothetical protein